MYANLKQLMRSAGYLVTEGDEWASTDTPIFQGFAARELGVPFSLSHHMLAYPQAFPGALERALKLGVELLGVPTDSQDAPTAESGSPDIPPNMPPVDPEAQAPAPTDSEATLSVSPEGQQPKQDLEPAPDADQGAGQEAEQVSDSTAPADQEATGGEQAGAEQTNQDETSQAGDSEQAAPTDEGTDSKE
jgi:hypothetical protein